ncbi:hypothetical protein [Halorubrum sp. F4]|uniref:hypothetical protein n=1 Tax=Halorubrum sp. F4 TaxID=2989715 RepID=UPI00248053C2|nr:hypothetical protein [Halorubrum sp. F4]
MSLDTIPSSEGAGDVEQAVRMVSSPSPVGVVRYHYLNDTVLELVKTEETPVINVAGLSPAYPSWVDRLMSRFSDDDALEHHSEVVAAAESVPGLDVAGAANRSVTLVPATADPEHVAELVDELEDALECDRVISTERGRL